jgi:hypothetical protein
LPAKTQLGEFNGDIFGWIFDSAGKAVINRCRVAVFAAITKRQLGYKNDTGTNARGTGSDFARSKGPDV